MKVINMTELEFKIPKLLQELKEDRPDLLILCMGHLMNEDKINCYSIKRRNKWYELEVIDYLQVVNYAIEQDYIISHGVCNKCKPIEYKRLTGEQE